jgi:hypothetical protein
LGLLAFEVLAGIGMPVIIGELFPGENSPAEKHDRHSTGTDASAPATGTDANAKGTRPDTLSERASKVDDIFEKTFSLIFGPTVALFASATGFYYGTKTDPQTPTG